MTDKPHYKGPPPKKLRSPVNEDFDYILGGVQVQKIFQQSSEIKNKYSDMPFVSVVSHSEYPL